VLQACCRRVSIRVRYQDFTKKRNQTQKRKEETRKENEQATMFTACKSPCLLHASHYLYYIQRNEKREETEERWQHEKDDSFDTLVGLF
jgi:arginyl-tRNA--protein-N-Asp/Glu arginylyltransferase